MMAETFIPDNIHGIPVGFYTDRGIAALLRSFCRYPAAVRFIADMLE
ncbi:hypothetical protein [Bradyrhizobium sp. C9]|nr:hypothetical protein [Bradyrhizobium sp. C9]